MAAPRVQYAIYANPAAYPPILHSAVILAGSGWDVDLFGVTQPRVQGLQFASHPRIRVELAPETGNGFRQKVHYVRFCLAVLWRIRRRRPGWVYISDTLCTPIALGASLLRGVKVVYHEHDSPSTASASLFLKALLAIRRLALRRVDLVVVPNAARGVTLEATAGKTLPLQVVWNCPERAEAAGSARPTHNDTFRVVYHGSIVPARVPESIVRALPMLPTVTLRIMGYGTAGHEGYIERLEALAQSLGVAARVEVKRLVPARVDLFRAVRECDLGLALMPSVSTDLNERNMTGASNKAFEYLGQGVPLLVSDLPDWRSLFADRGVARTCRPEDPVSVAGAIRWFVEHRAEANAMGERGRRIVIDEWHYERQFEHIRELMTGSH